MLDPAEQARILMEGDGGSDDEGGRMGTRMGRGQLRTKNEKPDVIVEKPDVTVTPEMKIEDLGAVENLVENLVLVRQNIRRISSA
jgi:H/ACA ribonucleoprotein complex non-core subunit NAF1